MQTACRISETNKERTLSKTVFYEKRKGKRCRRIHALPSVNAGSARLLGCQIYHGLDTDTNVACTNAEGNTFQTFTRPKSERWSWHSCVPLHKSNSCMSCLRRVARVPNPCVASVGALRNKWSKSACAVPLHILYRTPSMPMSRRSCRGARLNSRYACLSLISICLRNDDCTVSSRSNLDCAALKIAP